MSLCCVTSWGGENTASSGLHSRESGGQLRCLKDVRNYNKKEGVSGAVIRLGVILLRLRLLLRLNFYLNLWFSCCCSSGWLSGSCRTRREVEFMDGMSGTYGSTLAAETALGEVDVGHIILDCNGIELTLLGTLATTYAGVLAGLHCHGTLVLIYTRNKELATLWTLVADLYDALRARASATATATANILVNLGKTCFGIDLDGSELASIDAVATTEATEGTTSVASEMSGSNGTTLSTIVDERFGTHIAIAIAPNHSNFWFGSGNLFAQNSSHFFHNLFATSGAVEAIEIVGFGQSASETMTARETTATTVGARQRTLDLPNEGIFVHFEFLRDEVENHSRNATCDGQRRNSYQNTTLHVLDFKFSFYDWYFVLKRNSLSIRGETNLRMI